MGTTVTPQGIDLKDTVKRNELLTQLVNVKGVQLWIDFRIRVAAENAPTDLKDLTATLPRCVVKAEAAGVERLFYSAHLFGPE